MLTTAAPLVHWIISLLVTLYIVYVYVGHAMLVRVHREGYRWWTPIMEGASLALFAYVILSHPFR